MQQGDFRAALRMLEDALVEMDRIAAANKGSTLGALFQQMRENLEPHFLNAIGQVRNALGDFTIAAVQIDNAIRIAEQRRQPDVVLFAKANRAATDSHRGRYAAAIAEYEQQRAIFERANIPYRQAQTLNNLGRVLDEVGRYGEAIQTFEAARKLSTGRFRRGQAIASLNLAQIYLKLGSEPDTRSAADKALINFRTVGDRANIARTLTLLGQLHDSAGRPAEADKAYAEAADHVATGGSKIEAAQLALVTAVHYAQAGNAEKSRQSFAHAEALYHGIGDPFRTALMRLITTQRPLPNGTTVVDRQKIA